MPWRCTLPPSGRRRAFRTRRAQAPPGLADRCNTILGWGKWGVLVCGVAGLLICGGKMAIGHRNRSTLAADGATGIPWVLAGLSLAAVASAAIVGGVPVSPGRRRTAAPAPGRGRRHRRGRRRAGRAARPGSARAGVGSPRAEPPAGRACRQQPASRRSRRSSLAGAAVEQLPRSRAALLAAAGPRDTSGGLASGFADAPAGRAARRAEHRGPRQRAVGAADLRPRPSAPR